MDAKKLFILFFIALVSGCATLYDKSFLDSTPPVYLDAVLGPEEKLSAIEIQEVIPNSPADKAGFKPGDRIIYVNGEEVGSSARKLYKAFMDSCEKRFRELKVVLRRDGGARQISLDPADQFFKGNYGMRFKFTRDDGRRLKNAIFSKSYVSGDGIHHDAVYNVSRDVRLRTDCHLWGDKLLVIQFNLFNDSVKKNLHFNIKDVTVSNRWGSSLEPLSTEEIVNGVYNVPEIDTEKNRFFSLKKHQAKKLSAELNALHWELNTHRLKTGDIPPLNVGYGSFIYLFNPGHSPVTIRVKLGGKVFSAQYVMPQPDSEALAAEPRLTTVKEYDSFFDLLKDRRWLF